MEKEIEILDQKVPFGIDLLFKDKENNESNESGKKYGELLTLRQEKEVCQKQYQNEKKELDLRIEFAIVV